MTGGAVTGGVSMIAVDPMQYCSLATAIMVSGTGRARP